MGRVWAAVVATGVAAAGAAADPPPGLAVPADQQAKAKELVARLGSRSYPDREAATAELAKMKRAARPALADALATSPDPEVRVRAARLLPAAADDDLTARVKAFAADPDGAYDHDLPGWEAYRKAVGADPDARALFAAMLKSAPSRTLLVALGAAPKEAGQLIPARRAALSRFGGGLVIVNGVPTQEPRVGAPTVPDIAALLFVESQVPAADIPRGNQVNIQSSAMVLVQPVAMQALQTPGAVPHGEPFRQVVTAWLDSRTYPTDLGQLVAYAPQLAGAVDMAPTLRRAVTADGVIGQYKGQALVQVFTRDRKKEAGFVRSQLKNTAEVTKVFLGPTPAGVPVQAPVQVRDVALALLLADAGINIFDYGYDAPTGAQVNPFIQVYPQYAFPTDAARDAALRRWAERDAKR